MPTIGNPKKHVKIVGADRAALAGELTKKYTRGASIRALAEETGRSYGFVHRILTENEVALRARGGAPRTGSTPDPGNH